jgi:hypothetical protein
MTTVYLTTPDSVNSIPIRGRYLNRPERTKRECAFLGADLYCGRLHVVDLSLEQAAFLSLSTPSAVWWAAQRQEHREAILRGELPLVPAPSRTPTLPVLNGNGHAPPILNGNGHAVTEDIELFDVIKRAGVDRTINAAIAVERALHA